jgi:outer membrane protein
VPIFDRLFLGGARTLRGFDYREVGPKDETGEPVGGLVRLVWRRPSTSCPSAEKFRVAAFYDHRHGLRRGLRVRFQRSTTPTWAWASGSIFPGFPLRLDYAWPLEADEFNDRGPRAGSSLRLAIHTDQQGASEMKHYMAWLAAGWLAVAGLAQAQETKFAFVDLDKAFNEFYKTKLADAQLKTQAEEFKAERKKLVDDFKKLQEGFDKLREEAQNTALNEDVRSGKKAEAEEKLVEIREQESKIRRFDESRQKQLDEQSRRMRNRLVEEIQETVTKLARERGYTSVLDASGENLNGVPTVLYFEPKADITIELITLLNKGK